MSDELISDYFGRPIGRKKKKGDKTVVTDYFGRPLGSASDNGTQDYFGRPKSNENVPDILLPKEE